MNYLTKQFNQRNGESYDDWKYRILLAKKDGSCSLSWEEIRNLLGISSSAEYIRKIASGIAKYDEYLKTKNQCDGMTDEVISNIEDREFKLRREKMRMQDQKRELNKQLREWARAEHIQAEITKAIKELDMPAVQTTPCKNKVGGSKEGVLLLSDWHIGMNSANFANKFNDVVFNKRIDYLKNKVIEYARQNNIRRLNVFALGDFINGLIHVTTRINNTEDVIRQSMKAAETLCQLLGAFSEEIPEICVYFARGNHDRVSANIRESVTYESFFDLIPWYIQARIEGIENIKLIKNEIDSEIIVTKVCGNIIFAVHGHHDKPNKVVENLSLMLKTIPDYIFMGHYHSTAEREIQGAEVIVNGFLCGTDEYAVNIRKTSKPAQKFMIFDQTGRICTYNIILPNNKIKA